MNHDGALTLSLFVDVFEVEVERHLEVELTVSALPGSAERIAQVEVDLRTVERAVALVYDIGQIEFFERGFKTVGCSFPAVLGA